MYLLTKGIATNISLIDININSVPSGNQLHSWKTIEFDENVRGFPATWEADSHGVPRRKTSRHRSHQMRGQDGHNQHGANLCCSVRVRKAPKTLKCDDWMMTVVFEQMEDP